MLSTSGLVMFSCAVCGGGLSHRRTGSRYCSTRCRGRAQTLRIRHDAAQQAERYLETVRVEPAFGNWLAGFIDGEGCFLIEVRPRPNGRPTYSTRLSIVLRDDDTGIVEEIADTLGFGTVAAKRAQEGSHGGKPQSGWHVRDKLGCRALVHVLDEYPLRAKKARDYAIWREAAMLWQGTTLRGRVGTDPGVWERMGELRGQLIAARRYR